MILETFKSLVSRFKKHDASGENANRHIPPKPPLTAQGANLAPTALSTLETEPAVGTLPGSSVAVSNEQPTLHNPNSAPTVLDSPSTPAFFANSHHHVINNPTMVSVSNTFESGGGAIMQLLESKTIRGAEHDSSARYPPPKCHPETRQKLREDIFEWIFNPLRSWRLFYVLGPAGVGKSAVAQTVADDCKEADCLGASCFISRPNHRNDPDGVIPTLAYQLAVKHSAYKRIISQKLTHDPTILRKTRRVQFKELLIDPFHIIMTQDASAIQRPLLIIIDGLDECDSQGAQCEFIELIGNYVRSFPEFPLLWLICSRPEWHIKYAMSQADFWVTCRREEMTVDDEAGKRDVFLYLRSEFRNIRLQYRDSLNDNWPPAAHLRRIATAASGLFAFASTITRFVGDADAGDPSSQLQVCMQFLDGSNMPGVENPYLTLDLLYRHILTSIPSKTLPITMRILGMSVFYPPYDRYQSARTQASFLRIGRATFDHALKQLHSVLRIGSSSDTFNDPIEFYHASFGDFLRDPGRSGKFCLDEAAVHYDVALTALSWLVGLRREIREDDIWTSPSEDVQACLENVKTLSLAVLWKACSRVRGKNTMELYQELQKFDFSALCSDIPREWQFGDFLNWINLLERNSSTPKLFNSIHTYEECNESVFTGAIINMARLPDFIPTGFVAWGSLDEPKKFHFNLGNGRRRQHIHIILLISVLSEFERDFCLWIQQESLDFGDLDN